MGESVGTIVFSLRQVTEAAATFYEAYNTRLRSAIRKTGSADARTGAR